MHVKHYLLVLLALFAFAGLAACGETLTEPTPIPAPPASIGADSTTDDPITENTPAPTNLPDETAVEPTPTLIPTATATTTAEATAVTDPPVQVISSQPLPATNRDLLFLADGAFKQWNHTSRQIETIVPGPGATNTTPENSDERKIGRITDYAMSADGKRAVVARVLSTATDPEIENAQSEFMYELLFVDMVRREIWTLVSQVDNLSQFDLSPDAQQLAFVASGLNGIPDATSNEPIATNLYVLATGGGNPGNVRQVYSCQPRCIAPQWHIENNLVAFGDDVALWLYNIAADAPEMLLENQGYTPGMADIGEISIYSPIDWASNGRNLLMWHGRWEGGSRAVLDIPTGSLAEVPNSFVYADLFPTDISWMPDGRLLIWQTEIDDTNVVPTVELWRLNAEAGEIVLDESAALTDLPLGVTGGTYLEDGRFAFALDQAPAEVQDPVISNATGTYQLTSLTELPERVNSLAPAMGGVYQQVNVLWSQDGSGALLTQADRPDQPKIFYAPTDGEFLYEMTAVFGQNPHTFQWQPEITVP